MVDVRLHILIIYALEYQLNSYSPLPLRMSIQAELQRWTLMRPCTESDGGNARGVRIRRTSQKQARLQDCLTEGAVSQQHYERLVENFVIGAMQPFAVVEQEDFVQLLKSLAPAKKPLTRCMLVDRMRRRFTAAKSRLQEDLLNAKYVAATADCWKSYNRYSCHCVLRFKCSTLLKLL